MTRRERVIQRIKTYRNPDPRCTYPFSVNAVGYCCSYAHHVDGTKGFRDMLAICKNCELWNEKLRSAQAPDLEATTREAIGGGIVRAEP